MADGVRPVEHLPIMVGEVLACLRPVPGDVAVDCTLGGGGHARAILDRVRPGGRLVGLDVDPLELPRAEKAMRDAGFGPDVFVARHANFAALRAVLEAEGVVGADVVLADLGVSAMQFDTPSRGFSYKGVGPLDMRMNPLAGESAARLVARLTEAELARLLDEHADEPQAERIARLLKDESFDTTHALDRRLRAVLGAPPLSLDKANIKLSIRRTFQALRIAVNDEFTALDALLRALPGCLAPGGRAAIITFHSGEDRRVKKAFQAGHRAGVYAEIATEVVRSAKAETFSNRRAAAAKLRWAVRAEQG